jgi:hypothetical protein
VLADGESVGLKELVCNVVHGKALPAAGKGPASDRPELDDCDRDG